MVVFCCVVFVFYWLIKLLQIYRGVNHSFPNQWFIPLQRHWWNHDSQSLFRNESLSKAFLSTSKPEFTSLNSAGTFPLFRSWKVRSLKYSCQSGAIQKTMCLPLFGCRIFLSEHLLPQWWVPQGQCWGQQSHARLYLLLVCPKCKTFQLCTSHDRAQSEWLCYASYIFNEREHILP